MATPRRLIATAILNAAKAVLADADDCRYVPDHKPQDGGRAASRPERLAGKDNVRSKFRCRLYCDSDSYSSYTFIAFLSYFGGLNATAIRQFEKDFETLKNSLRKGGYAHLNCYGPECDYSMDDQKVLYFYGKLGGRRDNAILSKAAKAVGAEYFPRRWCGESVDP